MFDEVWVSNNPGYCFVKRWSLQPGMAWSVSVKHLYIFVELWFCLLILVDLLGTKMAWSRLTEKLWVATGSPLTAFDSVLPPILTPFTGNRCFSFRSSTTLISFHVIHPAINNNQQLHSMFKELGSTFEARMHPSLWGQAGQGAGRYHQLVDQFRELPKILVLGIFRSFGPNDLVIVTFHMVFPWVFRICTPEQRTRVSWRRWSTTSRFGAPGKTCRFFRCVGFHLKHQKYDCSFLM